MAQSGNGIDIGAVYQLLTQVVARLDRQQATLDRQQVTLVEHSRKLNEVVGIVNEHARTLGGAVAVLDDHGRKLDELNQRLVDLRDTVVNYHYSVVGHGIAVNELEERVKLIEARLNRDPTA